MYKKVISLILPLRTLLKILFIALLASNSISAQSKIEKIDSLFNDFYNAGMFNGSVLVSANGKVIYKKGFGYANFEYNIPNKTETKFKIGSCTKQFTAALIMILKKEGKLNLDDKITDYLPEYPAEKGDKITIHHLLSHTSGIPEYINLPELECLVFKENVPSEFMKLFWNLDLDFKTGTELKYSNSGYYVLGVIIERITGKPYGQALQEKIFNPLKMINSGVIDISKICKNKAYGYIKMNDSLTVAPLWNASGAFSAGMIYSTVEDLFKWQIALQSNSIISKESFDKMLSLNFSQYGYGFGVLKRTLKNGKSITLYGHEGQIPGFRALIHIIKEDNNSIILLDNNQNTNHFKIASAIRNILYEDN